MKTITFLLSIFLCSSLLAQDDLYYSPKMKAAQSDTALFKTDVGKIQYCLGNYYKERQTGFMVSILGGVISGVSILAIKNPNTKEMASVAGGIAGIAGIVITLDAEKWLKKASITISPTSLKINF